MVENVLTLLQHVFAFEFLQKSTRKCLGAALQRFLNVLMFWSRLILDLSNTQRIVCNRHSVNCWQLQWSSSFTCSLQYGDLLQNALELHSSKISISKPLEDDLQLHCSISFNLKSQFNCKLIKMHNSRHLKRKALISKQVNKNELHGIVQ